VTVAVKKTAGKTTRVSPQKRDEGKKVASRKATSGTVSAATSKSAQKAKAAQLSKPGKVTESGMGAYSVAKVVGAVAKRFASKSQTRPSVVKFTDPKTKAKPTAAKPSATKPSKAAKEQSSAAKSYTTKDPSRVSAAQKGAETRRRNAEAAMRAERRKGRRQGAIAVGATGTAALGVSAASGATKSNKK